MTVELDQVIDNLIEGELQLEIYAEDEDRYLMYIGTDNNSGAEYKIQSIDDIGEMVKHYLYTYYTNKEQK